MTEGQATNRASSTPARQEARLSPTRPEPHQSGITLADVERGRRGAAQGIERVCATSLNTEELFRVVGQSLRRVVPWDRACWHTLDPESLLFTGGVLIDLEPAPSLSTYEYEQPDVNQFSWLASQPVPVGDLRTATTGKVDRSARYRDLLRPLGISEELRATLVVAGQAWGTMALYRESGRHPFEDSEIAFISKIGPVVAEGVRRRVSNHLQAGVGARSGLAMLVFDRRGHVLEESQTGRSILADVTMEGFPTSERYPSPLVSLSARARRWSGTPGSTATPRVTLRGHSGAWYTAEATPMSSDDGRVAVVIQEASRTALARLLLATYGLTPRESDVTRLVLQGRSTSEIGRELFLSEYTVQDHLKKIFEKVGVRSRRALVAQVYRENFEQDPPPSAGDLPRISEVATIEMDRDR